MKGYILLGTLALLGLVACSDSSPTTVNDTPTFTACLATVSGTQALCATATSITTYTKSTCDSLGATLKITDYMPGATFKAAEACPDSSVVDCAFADSAMGSGHGYFYGTNYKTLGTLFCSQYAVSN